MTTPRMIECALPTGRRQRRRPARQTRVAVTPGRVLRVSRLLALALALRLDRLIRAGAIVDYATLARLGYRLEAVSAGWQLGRSTAPPCGKRSAPAQSQQKKRACDGREGHSWGGGWCRVRGRIYQ
jgi:hypothetical protein